MRPYVQALTAANAYSSVTAAHPELPLKVRALAAEQALHSEGLRRAAIASALLAGNDTVMWASSEGKE